MTTAPGQKPAVERGAARAVRLIFTFNASGVYVTRQYAREKPAPRGDDVRAEPLPHAVALELLSATGVVLYRQTLVNPIPQTVEAIGPGGRLLRLPRARSTGAFSAVVPNLDEATDVVLWAGPHVELRQPALARQPGTTPARRVLVRARFQGR